MDTYMAYVWVTYGLNGPGDIPAMGFRNQT